MPAPKPAANSAMAILLKAARLEPTKKLVVLNDGTPFEFWSSPLTLGKRKRAIAAAGTDELNELAIQFMIDLCRDAQGNKMFTAGMKEDLRERVREQDLILIQAAMLGGTDEALQTDMKSPEAEAEG